MATTAPPASLSVAFILSLKYYTKGEVVFFVRSGYVWTGGTLGYPGAASGYWPRSSISTDNAFGLGFNNAAVYPSLTAARYSGNPLRCLHP